METTNYLKFDEEKQQLYLDDVTIAETLNIPMSVVISAFEQSKGHIDYLRLITVEDSFRNDRPTPNKFQLFSTAPMPITVKEYRVYLELNNNLYDNILTTLSRLLASNNLLTELLYKKLSEFQNNIASESIEKWNILRNEQQILERYRSIHFSQLEGINTHPN